MTPEQVEELANIQRAMTDAQKRLDDLTEAIDRVRDSLTDIHRATLILRDSFVTPRAEEATELWRLPSGLMA